MFKHWFKPIFIKWKCFKRILSMHFCALWWWIYPFSNPIYNARHVYFPCGELLYREISVKCDRHSFENANFKNSVTFLFLNQFCWNKCLCACYNVPFPNMYRVIRFSINLENLLSWLFWSQFESFFKRIYLSTNTASPLREDYVQATKCTSNGC